MRIIGIDPDVGKNGVAVHDRESDTLSLASLELDELRRWLSEQPTEATIVVVEAGWLNESNWHLRRGDSVAMAARKGYAVGANHQRGKDIVEMARGLGFDVREVKPLRKFGHGAGGKCNAADFKRRTGWSKRSNQEERDAALLAISFHAVGNLEFNS